MNTINKEPERHEIEALLPWHAAGTLSRRDADRVEIALAGDQELARRYDVVREELAETIHLNETLGAPSSRAMEKLFAAIEAEEAHAPRRARSFDYAARVSEFLSSITPRALAWSATAAAVVILLQSVLLAGIVMKEQGTVTGPSLASTASLSRGSFAVVRFAPQATMADISHFLGAYKATVIEGPMRNLPSHYLVKLSEARLPEPEVGKIIRQMQDEKIVILAAAKE
ncbi:MAG: hypothetical protein ACJ8F3_09705 [Xanthobacteraceae bacterium]